MAARVGASVLLVEKTAELGGATGMSVGTISAARTALQQAAGIVDDVDAHFEDYLKLIPAGRTRGSYDLELTRLLIDSAPGVLRRMVDLGVRFSGPHPEPPHSVPRMHNAVPGGSVYIRKLAREARDVGVAIRTLASIAALDRVGNGEVTGVVVRAVESGERTRIHARRGVALATGYFGANASLARRYGRSPETEGIGSLPEDATGDGISAAMEVGAGVGEMDASSPPIFRTREQPYVRPEPHLFEAGAILVNVQGRRFANELDGPESAAARQPGGESFIVFDSQLAARIASAEDDSGPGRNGWLSHRKLFLSTYPAIAYAYIADYRARADFFEAGSPAALARVSGLPVGRFEETLCEVNRIARGESLDPFGRRRVGPGVSKPPFYAIGPLGVSLSSSGGLKIDANARVLDTSGIPIPRLYAAGINGSSNAFIAGHGHALVWAFATGQIAGRNAGSERLDRCDR